MKGAIIDPNDMSGQRFLNDQIVESNIGIGYYMFSATGGKPLDFKVTNGEGRGRVHEVGPAFFRGMPLLLGEVGSLPIYASARDVGNIAAGFVAGRRGMGWSTARLGYDGLQIQQEWEWQWNKRWWT